MTAGNGKLVVTQDDLPRHRTVERFLGETKSLSRFGHRSVTRTPSDSPASPTTFASLPPPTTRQRPSCERVFETYFASLSHQGDRSRLRSRYRATLLLVNLRLTHTAPSPPQMKSFEDLRC